MAFAYSLLFIAYFIMFASFPTLIEGNPHKRATGGMPNLLLDLFTQDQQAQNLDTQMLTNATLSSSTGLPQVVSLLERLVSQNQQISASMSILTKGLHLTAGDCSDVAAQGPYVSGTYEITPWDDMGIKGSFAAYCEITDDAIWTVIQRRLDGSVDFFRGWEEYKTGFGDLDEEFWLGLDKLYRLTNKTTRVKWQLKVELEDFEGNTAYADYDSFSVGDESMNFKLTVGAYSGTAGDPLQYLNNRAFSTKDRDNGGSSSSIASTCKGGWWYYPSCSYTNLNGPYLESAVNNKIAPTWYYWKNAYTALKKSQMKIKPMI